MRRIYLDHATTTPPDPRVREAMQPFLGPEFGSLSAVHRRGREARARVAEARETVARLLDAAPEEVLFTGSATEANNLAIKGIALAANGRGRILAAATEHLSVLHPLRSLERQGFEVSLLPVDAHGAIDLDRVGRELARGALLLSVAHASAEIGTVQPVDELSRLALEHGVPFHCDASASAGLLPWTGSGRRADLVTLTPHLFNGPQGVAALCVRGQRRLRPLIEGGAQEGGLRAGTEPLAAIVGFGAAAGLAAQEASTRAALADRRALDLRRRLMDSLDGLLFTGHPRDRIPGHLSLCVRGVEAESLLRDLDGLGIEAGSGSACVTEVGKPSHVLAALGVDPVLARGALTFMFGLDNADEDSAAASLGLGRAVRRLRAIGPGPIGPP